MSHRFHSGSSEDSFDSGWSFPSLLGFFFNQSVNANAAMVASPTVATALSPTPAVDPTKDTYYNLQWYLDNSIGRYVDAHGNYIAGTVIKASGDFNQHHGIDLTEYVFSDGTRMTDNPTGHFPVTHLIAGIDLNIQGAWKDYSGQGIVLGVFDNGVLPLPDYAHNLSPLQDPTFNPQPPSYSDLGGLYLHGSGMAMLMASSAGVPLGDPSNPSNTGIVGTAYQASIVAVNVFSSDNFLEDPAAYTYLAKTADVINASFLSSGYVFDGVLVPGVIETVMDGRHGLGSVQMWSGGNGRADPFDEGSLYENDVNPTRYVSAIAAVGVDGKIGTDDWYGIQPGKEYSSPGSALLVSSTGNFITGSFDVTFYKGLLNSPIGLTTFEEGGTSDSNALASGVAALILQANPDLGYRDVQEILALSARETDPLRDNMGPFILQGSIPNSLGSTGEYIVHNAWQTNGAQIWNGGGMHTSLDYGFGLIDATQAVRLAETWTKQSTYFNEAHLSSATGGAIDAVDGQSSFGSVAIGSGLLDNFGNPMTGKALSIEHVEVTVNLDLNRGSFNDATFTLIAPDGTRSILFNQEDDGGLAFPDFLRSDFMSTQFMGMVTKPGDVWKLEVTNNLTHNSTVTYNLPSGPQTFDTTPTITNVDGSTANNTLPIDVLSWGIQVFGNVFDPNQTFFLTNEMHNNTVIKDTYHGQIDTLNAAAIAGNEVINLNPGATSLFLVDSLYLFGTQDKNGVITPSHTTMDVVYNGVTYHEADYTNTGPLLPSLMLRTMTIDPNTIIKHVYGGVGNDVIIANSAGDVIEGGRGADLILGNGNNTTAAYTASLNGVHVDLSQSGSFDCHSVGGGIFGGVFGGGSFSIGVIVKDPGTDANGDILINVQNLVGSKHDDSLGGNSHDNLLFGGAGNDVLTGHGGHDTFLYDGLINNGQDKITDFNKALDSLVGQHGATFHDGGHNSAGNLVVKVTDAAGAGVSTITLVGDHDNFASILPDIHYVANPLV